MNTPNIEVRIDLGDVQMIVAGQQVTGAGTAHVTIDRRTLAALITGSLVPARTVDGVITTRQHPMIPPASMTPRKLAHVPDDELAAALASMTIAEAVAHYGVAASVISKERARLGIKMSSANRRKPEAEVVVQPDPVDEKPVTVDEPAVPIVEAPVTVDEIEPVIVVPEEPQAPIDAAESGVPEQTTVRRKMAKYSDEEIRTKIIELGCTGAAAHFEVSAPTIRKELDRLGIVLPQRASLSTTAPEISPPPAKRQLTVTSDRPSLTDVSDMELRQILASGRGLDAIAAEYATNTTKLKAEARRLGVSVKQEVVRSFADIAFRRAGNTH